MLDNYLNILHKDTLINKITLAYNKLKININLNKRPLDILDNDIYLELIKLFRFSNNENIFKDWDKASDQFLYITIIKKMMITVKIATNKTFNNFTLSIKTIEKEYIINEFNDQIVVHLNIDDARHNYMISSLARINESIPTDVKLREAVIEFNDYINIIFKYCL